MLILKNSTLTVHFSPKSTTSKHTSSQCRSYDKNKDAHGWCKNDNHRYNYLSHILWNTISIARMISVFLTFWYTRQSCPQHMNGSECLWLLHISRVRFNCMWYWVTIMQLSIILCKCSKSGNDVHIRYIYIIYLL